MICKVLKNKIILNIPISASLLLLTLIKIGIIDKKYGDQLFNAIESIKNNSSKYSSLLDGNDALELSKIIYNKFFTC